MNLLKPVSSTKARKNLKKSLKTGTASPGRQITSSVVEKLMDTLNRKSPFLASPVITYYAVAHILNSPVLEQDTRPVTEAE